MFNPKLSKRPKAIWYTALAVFAVSIGIMLTFGREIFSHFIINPQTTVPLLNNWAGEYKCFECSQYQWFFGADFFFAVSLFTLSIFSYSWLLEKNEKVLLSELKINFFKWHLFSIERINIRRVVFILFVLALLFDILETIVIVNKSDFALTVQTIKGVLYSLSWLALIHQGIKRLISWISDPYHYEVIKTFIDKYLSYFYPWFIKYNSSNSYHQFDGSV